MPNLPSMPQSEADSSDRVETLLHQVRNPLTALTTFAKLLEKRTDPADPNLWIVERMQRECQLMQALLAEFEMDGDRDEKHSQSEQSLDLTEFLQAIWPTYRTLAADRQIEAIANWNLPDRCPVAIDALTLRQVLDNLMDNALKYTPAGGRVTVAAEGVAGDRIAIQVSDTGPGIAAEALQQIFERHYRVGEDRPGHGLGLAIARELVSRAGGNLTASSEVGRGTTFTIELPAG